MPQFNDLEIDALPVPMIGLWEMEEYGYTWNEMLPLTQGRALELFDHDLPVYLLHEDGSETTVHDRKQITGHGGIFGIEKGDWENEKNFRAMREELEESGADREAQLLHGDTDKYGIYQLKDNPGLRDFHFAGTEELLKRGILSDDFGEIQPGNYNLVYAGELSGIHGQSQREKLNAVFEKFNIDHPADYKGHSLSVSDVVVLHENGENSAHFVDSFGFTRLPEFMKVLEGVKEQDTQKAEPEERQETSGHDVQKPEAGQTEQETYPAFYGHTLSYAAEHGEVDRYMESHKLDRECKGAIEETIRQNFDGMHLKHDIVKPLAEKYGAERMAFILANTLQQESWDGRFSRDNKAWASEFYIPENIVHGIDMNRELIVSSHPAVLDGFIGMFRREVLELEKEMSAGQDAQKPETGRQETEQPQAEAERPEPQAEQTGPGRLAKTPELEDLDEGDEIIDLGDEKDKVLAEMKRSLGGRQETSGHDVNQSAEQNDLKPEQTEPEETELAFQIADRYISIQETEGGYDYSIMGLDYKEIDGGVYDNPGIGIKEAINEIVEDLKIIPFDNGARGNIRDSDKLIPIDYDGLMEKAEAANAVMPQRDVVAAFKAKTNELFHEISEMNPAEIEETVKCHVQAQLDESGIDAVIVDVAVTGSRCRGLEQEGSDLDVVVELSTNEREDALFDMLNESGLHIGGVKVDINPITAQRTGSLETYLPQVEDYLEGVREARERDLAASISREENQKETKESLFPEQAETEVTLTVAECGEFHNLGEFYENIPTVEEAVAIWKQIPPERMHGIPAIGVNIHTPGTEAFEDVGIDILTGKRIDLDILEYIPDIKGNPQAMEVIAELAAKLPEMEIDGRMSEEFEAKVWEKRMPDLTPAEQLAVELDRFTYDYDTALYRDSSQSMTENVSEIAEALKQRDTHDIALWLADIAADRTGSEERKRAMELLEKLADLVTGLFAVLAGHCAGGELFRLFLQGRQDGLSLGQGAVRTAQPGNGVLGIALILFVARDGGTVVEHTGHAHRIVRGPVYLLLRGTLNITFHVVGKRAVHVAHKAVVHGTLGDAHDRLLIIYCLSPSMVSSIWSAVVISLAAAV